MLRECKTCGTEFDSIKDAHIFCSRKCFKKDYNIRMRDKRGTAQRYPFYSCQFCGSSCSLTFDPSTLDGAIRFNTFKCPSCGVTKRQIGQFVQRNHSRAYNCDAPYNTIATFKPDTGEITLGL